MEFGTKRARFFSLNGNIESFEKEKQNFFRYWNVTNESFFLGDLGTPSADSVEYMLHGTFKMLYSF